MLHCVRALPGQALRPYRNTFEFAMSEARHGGEMDQMVLMQDNAAISANDRPSYRTDLALLGIYEISKLLCGPGSLQDVLSGTMYVLHSFLDMGNGVIALIDSKGKVEDVYS